MKKLSTVLGRARSKDESVQSNPDVFLNAGFIGSSFASLGSMLTNVTTQITTEVFFSDIRRMRNLCVHISHISNINKGVK